MRHLADYEKKSGWRYSIICTNIPDLAQLPVSADLIGCG